MADPSGGMSVGISIGSPPGAHPPHPRLLDQLLTNLSRIEGDVASAEHLAAVHADIDAYGLTVFFHAVRQKVSGGAVPAAAGQAFAPTAIFPATAPLLVTGDTGLERQTWTNCIGSRVAQPLRVYRPSTLDEIRSIVRQAAAEGCRVKAVGAGHSFTDVAVTRDFLVDTRGLCRPLPIDPDVLRPGAQPETLFETEAGIRVRELNEALWDARLALVNMGGYDGQTIAGVISTSTHGSGLAFGPLSSQVESLTLVAGDGKTYRIEPRAGITDPDHWAARHPEVELRQDDAWFDACQVGVGCTGVIYSLVLRVRPRFYLKEERTLSVWSRVKADLEDGQVLRDNEHYEVLVNPYEIDGDHTCLITRRNATPEPDQLPLERPHRNFLLELAASIPGSSDLLRAVLDTYPTITPKIIDAALAALARDYTDRGYYVFNIGAANDVPAYGSEIGFTLDRYLAATERILAIAAKRRQVGQAYLTSPFSLRFVKASTAFMSMTYGVDTCMIEFPMLDDTVGGRELLQEIETEMYVFGGRPHWGLLNFVSGANGLVEAMYPMLPRWLEVVRRLDPNGTFANAFSERCGFSPRPFGRS